MKIMVITGGENFYRQQVKINNVSTINLTKESIIPEEEEILPKLTNNGSKEPQEQDDYSTSSFEKCN